MEIISILLFARQLLAIASAAGTIGQERVQPVLKEGDRRLGIMVDEKRGPNADDDEWIKTTRHGFVSEIEAAAANAPPGS